MKREMMRFAEPIILQPVDSIVFEEAMSRVESGSFVPSADIEPNTSETIHNANGIVIESLAAVGIGLNAVGELNTFLSSKVEEPHTAQWHSYNQDPDTKTVLVAGIPEDEDAPSPVEFLAGKVPFALARRMRDYPRLGYRGNRDFYIHASKVLADYSDDDLQEQGLRIVRPEPYTPTIFGEKTLLRIPRYPGNIRMIRSYVKLVPSRG